MEIPHCHLLRHAFDEREKINCITNTMIESFNNQLDIAKALSILSLLEHIRRKVMKSLRMWFANVEAWPGEVPPRVQRKVDVSSDKVRHIKVVWVGGGEYELKDETNIFNINLDDRTCDSKGWQISGVPCTHVIACIWANKLDVLSYIHESSSKTMYVKTYGGIIHPIPDRYLWAKVDYDTILSPQVKKLGRPKLARRKGVDEDTEVRAYFVKCDKHKQHGHN